MKTLTFALLASLTLNAFAQTRADTGGNTGGGGNTVDDQVLDTYENTRQFRRIDPATIPSWGSHLEPALRRLESKYAYLPNYLRHIRTVRGWYFTNEELRDQYGCLNATRFAVARQRVAACHTSNSRVLINEPLFQRLPAEEQGQLLMHELLVSVLLNAQQAGGIVGDLADHINEEFREFAFMLYRSQNYSREELFRDCWDTALNPYCQDRISYSDQVTVSIQLIALSSGQVIARRPYPAFISRETQESAVASFRDGVTNGSSLSAIRDNIRSMNALLSGQRPACNRNEPTFSVDIFSNSLQNARFETYRRLAGAAWIDAMLTAVERGSAFPTAVNNRLHHIYTLSSPITQDDVAMISSLVSAPVLAHIREELRILDTANGLVARLRNLRCPGQR